MRKTLLLAAVAGVLFAGSANALTVETFTFDTTEVAGFSGSSFGTVTVTDSGAGLDFAITLSGDLAFRYAPDNNHWDLAFNLDTAGKTLTGLTPTSFFQASGSTFKASPFGSAWNYAVDCTQHQAATAGKPAHGSHPAEPPTPEVPGCLPGTSATNPTTMSFSIAGITFDDLNSSAYDSKNIFFVADVVNSNGNTGNIGATRTIPPPPPPPPGVPEPAAWALMIVGFGGAGAMLRRKRRADTLA